MRKWVQRKRLALGHHYHSIHRGEQLAHIVLYGSLAVGFKEIYVVMGGVVAFVIFVVILSDAGEA